MARTRQYYHALGYGAPYAWAHFDEVPFARLPKALSACRVALVTTAAPYQSGKGEQGPGAPTNAAAKFFAVYSDATAQEHDLRIAHVAIDRLHTTAEDPGSYFPLHALRRAVASGRIGALTPNFHGAPTQRSQRTTLDVDGPEIVARCLREAADVALLVANCPVCHQSLSLIARLLEAAGIATVVMGCARDIVEHVGVPRLLFSDFPLGNAAGRPLDVPSQDLTLELAMRALEEAQAPRFTLASPLTWGEHDDWKLDYCNVERMSAQDIAQRRAEFDHGKTKAREVRKETALAAHVGHDPDLSKAQGPTP